MRSKCPKCRHSLSKTENLREKTIIDLKIKKNGFQKKVIKYLSLKGYCEKCRKTYDPEFILTVRLNLGEFQKYDEGNGFSALLTNKQTYEFLPPYP